MAGTPQLPTLMTEENSVKLEEALLRLKQGERHGMQSVLFSVPSLGRTDYECIWMRTTTRKAAEEAMEARRAAAARDQRAPPATERERRQRAAQFIDSVVEALRPQARDGDDDSSDDAPEHHHVDPRYNFAYNPTASEDEDDDGDSTDYNSNSEAGEEASTTAPARAVVKMKATSSGRSGGARGRRKHAVALAHKQVPAASSDNVEAAEEEGGPLLMTSEESPAEYVSSSSPRARDAAHRQLLELLSWPIDVVLELAQYLDVFSLARLKGTCHLMYELLTPSPLHKLPFTDHVVELCSFLSSVRRPCFGLVVLEGRSEASRKYVLVSSKPHTTTALENAFFVSTLPTLLRSITDKIHRADPQCDVVETVHLDNLPADRASSNVIHRAYDGSPLEGFWDWCHPETTQNQLPTLQLGY